MALYGSRGQGLLRPGLYACCLYIFISCGCHKKLSQAEVTKNNKRILSYLWKPENLNRGSRRALFPLEPLALPLLALGEGGVVTVSFPSFLGLWPHLSHLLLFSAGFSSMEEGASRLKKRSQNVSSCWYKRLWHSCIPVSHLLFCLLKLPSASLIKTLSLCLGITQVSVSGPCPSRSLA